MFSLSSTLAMSACIIIVICEKSHQISSELNTFNLVQVIQENKLKLIYGTERKEFRNVFVLFKFLLLLKVYQTVIFVYSYTPVNLR